MSTPEWLLANFHDAVTVYPNRDLWLADSRSAAPDCCIGASTAYRMLCGAFGGLWGVIHEHRSGERPSLDDNHAVATGLRLEPVAIEEYRLATGFEVWSPGYHRVGADWLRVSPDAWAYDPEHGLGLVENKIPMPNQMRYWANNEEGTRGDLLAPERYEVQALVQATACRLAGVPVEWVDCWAWFGPHITRRVRYRFSLDQMQAVYRDLHALRSAYLVGDAVPEVDDSDECKAELMRDWSAVGTAECPQDLRDMLYDLHLVRDLAKVEAAKVSLLSNQIRSAWPEGVKTLLLPADDDSKPPQATLSARGTITLTRF